MKDEALSNDGDKFALLPIAPVVNADSHHCAELSTGSISLESSVRQSDADIADWLRHEMTLNSIPMALRQASLLDSDTFVAAVRAALPRRQSLTPTQLRQLRDAFAETAEPARTARGELLAHERALAAMVERAYGLTDEDIALMWRTAPPRMPLPPPPGLLERVANSA